MTYNPQGFVEQIIRRAVQPPQRTGVTEWCEQHVKLSPAYCSRPGKWKSALTPYVRQPLEDFGNPSIRQITLCWPSQVAKSETLLNALRFGLVNDPAPYLWATSNEVQAKSFSEQRLQVSLRDCRPIAAVIPADENKFKLLEMVIGDSVLYLTGSNSPSNLASRSVKVLLCDEVDKWPSENVSEAGSFDLLRMRVTSFFDHKILVASTPSDDVSLIWRELVKGSHHIYLVPCPHCNHFQQLTWDHVKAPFDISRAALAGKPLDSERLKQDTAYECGVCHKLIAQNKKPQMLAQGKWEQTNLEAPADHRSYHLSALYSPFVSWGDLMVEWVTSHKDRSGLRNFVNSFLAERWIERVEPADYKTLEARKGDYTLADVKALGSWPLAKRRFMVVDVQEGWFAIVIRDWGLGGASRLVAWKKCFTWDDVESIRLEYGVKPNDVGVDDAGSRQSEVDQVCLARGYKPYQGTTQQSFSVFQNGKEFRRHWTVSAFDPQVGTRQQQGRKMSRYLLASNSCRSLLLTLLRGQAGQWEIPQDVTKEYLDGVLSEKPLEKIVNGQVRVEWKQVSRFNHPFDLEVAQATIASMVGLLDCVEATVEPPLPAAETR